MITNTLWKTWFIGCFMACSMLMAPVAQADTLDVDGSGIADALSDGLIVMRYLLGYRGEALTRHILADDEAPAGSTLETSLSQLEGSQVLDVDGDGLTDAATDGILILRYLFGFRGLQLVDEVVGPDAPRSATEINAYLAELIPVTSRKVAVSGIVQLGYVSGADVDVYDAFAPDTPLASTTTSVSMEASEAGHFRIPALEITSDRYYLFRVRNGTDLDPNDTGRIAPDLTATNTGEFYGIALGRDLIAGNPVRVTALSDLVYRWLKSEWPRTDASTLNLAIGVLAQGLVDDISQNGIVDRRDLLGFRPVLDKAQTLIPYSRILNFYIPGIYRGEDQASMMTRALAVLPPRISIDNDAGPIQQVPFTLSLSAQRIPAVDSLVLNWKLDGQSLSSEDSLTIDIQDSGEHRIELEVSLEGTLVSRVSTLVVGTDSTPLANVDALPGMDSRLYVYDDEGGDLGGVEVHVSPSALRTPVRITARQPVGLEEIPGPIQGRMCIGKLFELGPAGTVFDTPVQVQIPYQVDVDPDNIYITRYSENGDIDEIRPTRVDQVNRLISFETTHFSIFEPDAKLFGGVSTKGEAEIKAIVDALGIDYTTATAEVWLESLNSPVDSKGTTIYDLYQHYAQSKQINRLVGAGKYRDAYNTLYADNDEIPDNIIAPLRAVKLYATIQEWSFGGVNIVMDWVQSGAGLITKIGAAAISVVGNYIGANGSEDAIKTVASFDGLVFSGEDLLQILYDNWVDKQVRSYIQARNNDLSYATLMGVFKQSNEKGNQQIDIANDDNGSEISPLLFRYGAFEAGYESGISDRIDPIALKFWEKLEALYTVLNTFSDADIKAAVAGLLQQRAQELSSEDNPWVAIHLNYSIDSGSHYKLDDQSNGAQDYTIDDDFLYEGEQLDIVMQVDPKGYAEDVGIDSGGVEASSRDYLRLMSPPTVTVDNNITSLTFSFEARQLPIDLVSTEQKLILCYRSSQIKDGKKCATLSLELRAKQAIVTDITESDITITDSADSVAVYVTPRFTLGLQDVSVEHYTCELIKSSGSGTVPKLESLSNDAFCGRISKQELEGQNRDLTLKVVPILSRLSGNHRGIAVHERLFNLKDLLADYDQRRQPRVYIEAVDDEAVVDGGSDVSIHVGQTVRFGLDPGDYTIDNRVYFLDMDKSGTWDREALVSPFSFSYNKSGSFVPQISVPIDGFSRKVLTAPRIIVLDGSTAGEINHPPVVEIAMNSPSPVHVNDRIALQAKVSDEDRDSIVDYSWSVTSEGYAIPDYRSSSVWITAPATAQTLVIKLEVMDGRGATAYTTKRIVIEGNGEPFNSPPQVQLSDQVAEPETLVSVVPSASDPDGDAITSYAWSVLDKATNQLVFTSGEEILRFQTPALAENQTARYQIVLVASDARGAGASAGMTLTVAGPVIVRQLSFVGDDVEEGAQLEGGSTTRLTWRLRNSGNVALENVLIEPTQVADQLTVTPIEPSSIAQWLPGEVREFTTTVTVPDLTPEGSHYQRWDLRYDSDKLLYYANGALAHFYFDFTTPGPDTLSAFMNLASTIARPNEPIQGTIDVYSGNPPYDVEIAWADGTVDRYPGLYPEAGETQLTKAFAHSYGSTGNRHLILTVTDVAGLSAVYQETVVVSDQAGATQWRADARDIVTNEASGELPIQVTAKTNTQGQTYGEYFANWSRQGEGHSEEFFVNYRLPVPPAVIGLDKKVRLTAVVHASAIPAYDRSLVFKTSGGKEYIASIRDTSLPEGGFIEINDLVTGVSARQLDTGLTDDIKNGSYATYTIELDDGFKVGHYQGDQWSELASTPSYHATGEWLSELGVTFKGNGFVRWLLLEYDEDGDGEYGDGEAILLSTVDRRVEWAGAGTGAGGVISGTVTDSDGNPAVEILVIVNDSDSGVTVGTTHTDATGHYDIGELNTGTYIMLFRSFGAYVSEWYENAGWYDGELATEIAVTAGTTTTIDAQLVQAGHISGNVTDSEGNPLSDITVTASFFDSGSIGTGTSTDASGYYELGGLAARDYWVEFSDPSGTYISQYYNDARDKEHAADVAVTVGGTTSGIDAALARAAHITGTVTDANANPLSGIQVEVYNLNGIYGGAISPTFTDGAGHYDVGGLAAGTYRIGFSDNNGNYRDKFYDSATSFETATDVVVTDAGTTSGIDAVLARGAHITGTVTDANSTPLAGIAVTLRTLNGTSWGFIRVTFTDDAGHYDASGLAAGTYRISFDDNGGSSGANDGNYAKEFYNNAGSIETATDVVVTDGGTTAGIDAQLYTGGNIGGTVTDNNGNPLQGINVTATILDGGTSTDTPTDASGHFVLNRLPTGAYRVSFGDPNGVFIAEYYDDAQDQEQATDVTVTSGGTATITAQLARADNGVGGISGIVTNSAGDPLQGINVLATPLDGGTSTSTPTDASGNFVLNRLPTGAYRVSFGDPNGVFIAEYYDDAQDQEQATDVTVTSGGTATITAQLARADNGVGGISGTVTNSAGDPLYDITVSASYWDGSHAHGFATNTDPSGHYDLSHLAPRDYWVDFQDLSGVYVSEYYDDAPDQDHAATITVTAGATASGVDAILARGAHITGTVTNVSGNPVPGIQVVPRIWNGSWWDYINAFAFTDDSGGYDLGGLAAGTYRIGFRDNDGNYLEEFYAAAASVEAATDVVVAAEGTTSDIDAQLDIGSHITGTVTDSAGRPLASVQVTASSMGPGCLWSYYGSASSDADGHYDIDGLGAADYKVLFGGWGQEYPQKYYSNVAKFEPDNATPVVVAAGSTTSHIDAELADPARISGRVTDANHAPVSGVGILPYWRKDNGSWVSDWTPVTTDADGNYEVGGLIAGTYRIEFTTYGVPSHLGQFYGGGNDLDNADDVVVTAGDSVTGIDSVLGLAAVGGITGTITRSVETPLSGVDVQAYRWDSGDWGFMGDATSDADGHYAIAFLKTGTYRLEFDDTSLEYAGAPIEGIAVIDGNTTLGVDAELVPAGHVTGTVTSHDGEPLGSAMVSLFHWENGDWISDRSITTDVDGYFHVSGLSAGNYRLRVIHGSGHATTFYNGATHLGAAADIPVTAGSTTAGIDVQLPDAGYISGVITDSANEAVACVTADAYRWSGVSWMHISSATTDANGHYSLGSLNDGAHRVTFEDFSSRNYVAKVYDDAGGLESGTDILVSTGTTVTDIDAELLSSVGTAPITPTLISPSGLTTETRPSYRWNPDSVADRYRLRVSDSSGTVILTEYTAISAGCASGYDTCSHTSPIELTKGDYGWSVKATNAAGESPWSEKMEFTVTGSNQVQ